MPGAKLTIGHIARAAGVHIETVRYYQRRGLVSLPPKRARGFRYYTHDTASRVRFTKGACTETRSLAVAKFALVENKLVDLARLRDVLQGLVAACNQPHGTICPI